MKETRLSHEIIITLLSDPAFNTCLDSCLEEPELISNFCRIYQVELPRQPRNGLEAMVDIATGYQKDTYDKFFTEFIPFVHRCVYLPLKAQYAAAEPARKGG